MLLLRCWYQLLLCLLSVKFISCTCYIFYYFPNRVLISRFTVNKDYQKQTVPSTNLHIPLLAFPAPVYYTQWRREDLLRGGAKMEIMSRGTYDGLQGRVQQLLDD